MHNVTIPNNDVAASSWLAELASAVANAGRQATAQGPKSALISRPIRLRVESRAHHLMRVAEENSIPGIIALGQRLGATPSSLLMLKDDALGQVFRGIPTSELPTEALRTDAAAALVRRRLWSRSRICPECVRCGLAASADFDMPLTLRCDAHELRLIDTCPECESPLTYYRRQRDYCDCGQRLSQIKGEPLGLAADLFKVVFAPWRTSTAWTSDPYNFATEELRSALALRSLIDELESGVGDRSRASPWLKTTDWPLIENLLSVFPSSLSQVLSDICDDLGEKPRAELLARLSLAALPQVQPVIADVRAGRVRSRSYSVLSTPNGEAPLVSKASIRQLAKLDAAAATRLIENELATPDFPHIHAVGGRIWVPCSAADALGKWHDQTADLTEAGRILGCSPDFVLGLFKANLLPGVCLSAKPRSPRFQRRALDKHLLHLVSLRQSDPGQGEIVAVTLLVPASNKKKHWRAGWREVMARLINRRVPAIQIEGRVGWSGVGVRIEELISILGPRWKQTYVSG